MRLPNSVMWTAWLASVRRRGRLGAMSEAQTDCCQRNHAVRASEGVRRGSQHDHQAEGRRSSRQTGALTRVLRTRICEYVVYSLSFVQLYSIRLWEVGRELCTALSVRSCKTMNRDALSRSRRPVTLCVRACAL